MGAALIVLLTVVAYIPALRGGFIWDDDNYVTNNQTLHSVEGLRQIWLNPEATVQYYPLTFTVFWIEYHLWGLHPFGFHLLNVLLQAANALLFWRLLSRLNVPGAWWAAAVFALHPVHVMSVAWITELKNVLSGVFFLTALLLYLRSCGLDGNPAGQRSDRRWLYGMAMAMYLCALLSKTATSILPVAILSILWWKKGRIGRKDAVAVVPFFVIAILLGGFTIWLERFEKGASGREFALSFADRFLVAGRSFWFCLGKLVWPTRLMFIYPRWQIDATAIWPYLFPLGTIALLVTLWWARRWVGRAPLAAMVYFSLAFPVLVMVQVLYMMRYSFVADHWQYLGSMSVIPLGVGGAVTAWQRWNGSHRKVGMIAGALVLIALGMLSWRQCESYRDSETLWRDTLAKNPHSWMAHNNLGTVFAGQGRLSEANSEYREALRIKPDHATAHNNLGSVLVRLGKTQEAIDQYEQALRFEPDYSEAHNNLGLVLMQVGRTPEAIKHFEQALKIKRDNAEYYNNLEVALQKTGGNRGAIGYLEQAVRLRPEDPERNFRLGVALGQAGRLPEAVGYFERALQNKPDYAEAHYNLGVTLARMGRVPEAMAHWEQALQLKPDYAEAHYNLGVILEQEGRVPEALGHFEQAVRLKSDYAEALNSLAWLLGSLAPSDGGDPARAVNLAERACKLTGNHVAMYLDTLGAAYAAAGRFEEAIASAQKAIDLARSAGQPQTVEEIQTRLQLYRSGNALRQPSP